MRFGELEVRRLVIGDGAGRDALQDLLERCGDYVTVDEGAPAGPTAADELLVAVPPGRKPDDKRVLGLGEAGGDRLCGVIDVLVGYPDASDWWIGLFLFDPAVRRRGVGARVLADAEAYFRAEGATTSYLAVLERNPDAQRFWSRMGYTVLDRKIRRVGDREDPVLRMAKRF